MKVRFATGISVNLHTYQPSVYRMNDQEREKSIYKVTLIGGVVNLLLVLFKFIAGIAGHSAAMIADAVHSLSDFVTDVIVIVFVRISGKPEDNSHRYGHGKFETLATLIISVFLLLVGVGIGYSGAVDIMRVIQGENLPSPGMVAFVAAIVSILSKEVIFRYTIYQGKVINSDVVVANAWHHRSDVLSSVGTALGIGGAIFLGSKWIILDPLAALIVSIFIVRTAILLTVPAINELMEKALPEEVEKEITATVNSFPQVGQLHNLHTRKIGSNYAIEFHIRMNGETPLKKAHATITEIEKKLREHYGRKTHIMIHMEPF